MKLRRFVAPVSVGLLIIVAGLAFNLNIRHESEYPPPILDPEFDLWVSDPDLGGSRPMVWSPEYTKGLADQIRLEKTELSKKKALEIQIYQDGTNGNWTYIHLGQKIDGARLQALFDMKVSVSVFSSSSCDCSGPVDSRQIIFGIQTNDGTHVITFIFSDRPYDTQQSPSHRTVIFPTPSTEWTSHTIDLAREYDSAQWKQYPEQITFNIIFEVAGSAAGWHAAYVHHFSWTGRSNTNPADQNSEQLRTLPDRQIRVKEIVREPLLNPVSAQHTHSLHILDKSVTTV